MEMKYFHRLEKQLALMKISENMLETSYDVSKELTR
jgi:hypothetical protein